MKTVSFSLTVPKSPTLFCASLAETEVEKKKFQFWGSDFNLAEILQMAFAKAVLKFAYFHSHFKNCRLNSSGWFGKQDTFQGMGKE